MTSHHDPEDWLRVTVARSRDAFRHSEPPAERILALARTRGKRRRAAALVGTACVLAVGLTLAPLPMNRPDEPAQPSSPTAGPIPTPSATPHEISARIGAGTVDGRPWSVSLEFSPTLPEGYTQPVPPHGSPVPATSLLCQRMYIGGVRIDHRGGPWSDCRAVDGVDDPQESGNMGLWGLQDKGTSGTRLMVADPEADVAYGVLTFSDGSSVKASTVAVPGTGYRAWAAPIAEGRTIAAVDQYDARHHLLSHDTEWR